MSQCGLFQCLADPKKGAQALLERSKDEALYIVRNHIHQDLKSEYMMEENPRELWKNLKQCYEQHKATVLPEATHEWNHLRLQDFKTVDEYNHVVHKLS
jgi:nucleotidyltransferase/DNA polymerase involved in DNA repair